MEDSKAPFKVLVIEDNCLLREGITALLSAEEDMRVFSSAGDGENIKTILFETNPDIVLLDLGLAKQNSLSVAKLINSRFSMTRVIVMDLIPDQKHLIDFVKFGVSGFILKDATTVEFIKTIRRVHNGEKILPDMLTNSLFTEIISSALSLSDTGMITESARLSSREHQIIKLIKKGMTNKEIARMLNLSSFTVKSHVHNILEKLELRTRVQIACYASMFDSSEGCDEANIA